MMTESNHTPAVLVAFHIVDEKSLNCTNTDKVTDNILICKTFFIGNLVGSFFSCIYNGQLRIHVVFNEDIDSLNDEISKLIRQSMETAGMNYGTIWFRRTSKNIISYVDDKFILTADSEEFFYYSTEYIMRRDRFNKTLDNAVLEIKPYEENHIDSYLDLLNDSMSFFIPPYDFSSEKEKYLHEFIEYKNKNAFEAFWRDGKLVGLYWIVGTEVDTMGVSSEFQRLGYGSIILTRAIKTIFEQQPDAESAILYCVGWNAKAQRFYKRYGMEINKQHKVPYNVVNPT